MALYKYKHYLQEGESVAFDALHTPGTVVSNSGIYRCEGCNDEIAANKDNPLPPQNHHQHSLAQGKILWRLIAFAQQVKNR